MAKKNSFKVERHVNKKKTSIGNSVRTKTGRPGPNGGNKGYKKRYRGQGK
jgi:hypothetical protein